MLSLLLGSTYILNPISMTYISAEEKSVFITPAAEFAMGSMAAINKGEGAFTGDSGLIHRMKDADDFTFNVNVKLTGTSAAETLFFIGNSTKNDNYVLIYVTPNQTIGIEACNGDERPLNVVKDTGINLKNGDVHTITFTQKKAEYYRFYVDGSVVLEGMAASSFCKGLLANPDFLGIGAGKRLSYGNYPYTGELGSVQIFDSAITEFQIQAYHKGVTGEGDIAFEASNAYFPKDTVYESSSSADLATRKAMDSGAITIRYQAASASSSAMSLFSIADSTQPNNYLSFYVNPSANSFGVKISSSSKIEDLVMNKAILDTHNVSLQNTEWHTLTVVKSSRSIGDMSRRYTFYADGKLLNMYSDRDGFLNTITNADAISIGFNNTSTESDKMKFTGSIDNLIVYKKFLDEEEAKKQHTIGFTSSEVLDMTNAMRKDYGNLFYPGYHDSADYRIPTVIETIQGAIITAVDKRNSGAGDNGNIDTAIQRKEAGSDTFSDLQTVLDLIDNKGSTPAAFAIDPTMVQNKKTGHIFMLVDMFPESKGMVDPSVISPGSGYKKIDGMDYQLLYTADNQEYTIRENGVVYNSNNEIYRKSSRFPIIAL